MQAFKIAKANHLTLIMHHNHLVLLPRKNACMRNNAVWTPFTQESDISCYNIQIHSFYNHLMDR